MFLNIVKTAIRNLRRHKGYAFINVAGLALGMAACLLILLWIMHELSYDRFHENADFVYRVEQDQNYSGEIYHVTVTPYPMGPGIEADIPEIVESTRWIWMGTSLIRQQDKVFFQGGIRAVDPSFLTMFSFPLIKGDRETALDNIHSILITEEMAVKYFGDDDPLGKTLMVNNTTPFTVTGVFQDVPSNSSYSFNILVPFEYARSIGRYSDSWGSNSIVTFVQLAENASIPEVNRKITDIRHNHVAKRYDDPEELQAFHERPRTEFMVKPLTGIHLFSHWGYGKSMGAIQYVYIFGLIAIFVLLIACINFMNLATARSTNRAKEVGLRKVVGAVRHHLIGQFYGESIFMALIALVFAMILVAVLLPQFNVLSGKELSFNAILTGPFLLGMLAITLLTGIISGSYPALFLSAFKPAKVLKGALKAGVKSGLFRKVLVVTQFSLSIFLIIGTGFVYKQTKFMQAKKLGYDQEHLIYISLRGDMDESYEVVKNALVRDSRVINVSGTSHPPTHIGSNSSGAEWDGMDPDLHVLISQNGVDFDYIETMKIEMAEGRTFSKTFTTDTATAFMINEELRRIMGFEQATGKRFSFQGIDGTIIGVMKNFHFQSVRYDIEPLAFVVRPEWVNYMVIRLPAGDPQPSLDFIRETWERLVPNYPLEYQFVDEDLDGNYRAERRMGNLLQTFAVLAILIASLGLFGLASFTAEQRTKEIGVRKVLGATVPNVVILLSREFTKWVLIANVIAWPASYFIMKNWIQGFAYRTTMAWWVFLGSGLLALIIALLTVSYQSIRAAMANPVMSLRYE